MHSLTPPPPSRKSLILPALLFAVPLALVQGATILFIALNSLTPPWLLGTAVCSVLGGGLCALRTTSNVLDETRSTNWGRLSGLLTGLFSSLLALVALALIVVWYTNWWIPALSPQRPPGCETHVTPLSCMSPQAGAKFGLIFLPFEILVFLLGNVGFVLLAMLGGTLAARLRAHYIPMKQR